MVDFWWGGEYTWGIFLGGKGKMSIFLGGGGRVPLPHPTHNGKPWMIWFLLLLSFNTKNRETHTGHTGVNILTLTYKYTVMCHLYYIEWITFQYISLLYKGLQCLFCSKITHLYKSYICWLDSTRLSPSCEAQSILIEMIKMGKIHTPHTERNITLERVS